MHGQRAGHEYGDDGGGREDKEGQAGDQAGQQGEGGRHFQKADEVARPRGQPVGGEFLEHVGGGSAAVGGAFVEAEQPDVEQAAADDDLADLGESFHGEGEDFTTDDTDCTDGQDMIVPESRSGASPSRRLHEPEAPPLFEGG